MISRLILVSSLFIVGCDDSSTTTDTHRYPASIIPAVTISFKQIAKQEKIAFIDEVTISDTSFSGVVHSLPIAKLADIKHDDSLLCLTNGVVAAGKFGICPLIPTRHGVRCISVDQKKKFLNTAQQAHHGQLLACLAISGVSLDFPIELKSGHFTVGDLLNDMVMNFSLEAEEIEWECMSIILYMSPQEAWVNKFGERLTFDDMATELLRRHPNKARSCFGIHLMQCLAYLYIMDSRTKVLTEQTKTEIIARLKETSAHLETIQSPDGSWGENWSTADSKGDAVLPHILSNRLLSTSHNVEWLSLLPPDLRPSDECLISALRYLYIQLKAISPDFPSRQYCPYSHSVYAILSLTRADHGGQH